MLYFSAPLNAAYLAYGLKKAKIDFDLCLCAADNPRKVLTGLCRALEDPGAIAAIGCYSDVLPHVLLAVKKIKRKYPEKIIILGGIGPSMVAEEIISGFKCVDYVIRGCGIVSLPALIWAVRNNRHELAGIRGLVFRKAGRIVSNRAYEPYENIPDTPGYSALKNIKGYRVFLLATSSGCPYQCTFCCASPACGKKVVKRSLRDVMSEIREIKRIKGSRKFRLCIIDEAFIIDRKRVLEFCSLLRKSKLGLSWTCYGRVDRMDRQLLMAMKNAGCSNIYYGIESGSNSVLKRIKKGFTIELAAETLLLSKMYIPEVMASFIYRYPFETLKDFMDTYFYMTYFRHKDIDVQLHPLMPVKNSEIYRRYKKNLRFREDEQSHCLFGRFADKLPAECLKLIKSEPRVFYDHAYYRSKELLNINSFIGRHVEYIYGKSFRV